MAKTVPTWRSARLPVPVSRVTNACLKRGRTRFLQRQRVEGLQANGPLRQEATQRHRQPGAAGTRPAVPWFTPQSPEGLRPFLDPSLGLRPGSVTPHALFQQVAPGHCPQDRCPPDVGAGEGERGCLGGWRLEGALAGWPPTPARGSL